MFHTPVSLLNFSLSLPNLSFLCPVFSLDLLAYALSRFLSTVSNWRLAHACTHARIESHRKTRHAFQVSIASSREREMENMDSAMA